MIAIRKGENARIRNRFPRLKLVSVESCVGWIGSALEAMDWQWRNSGVAQEHPEYALLPSESFERQIYACFWFEGQGGRAAVERYPDNFLYETDFPQTTSMFPGPQTIAEHPRDYSQRVWGDLPEATARKVFHDNAIAMGRLTIDEAVAKQADHLVLSCPACYAKVNEAMVDHEKKVKIIDIMELVAALVREGGLKKREEARSLPWLCRKWSRPSQRNALPGCIRR